MKEAICQFYRNIRQINDMGSLAIRVDNLTTTNINVDDIYRAQIVLAVSALDHLVHEIVRHGMIEAASGLRGKTDAYRQFQLPISATEAALDGAAYVIWIGEEVRKKHSWQSFQDPERIADAIRLVSDVKLWEAVGQEIGVGTREIKTQLKLIVDRRNKIAHEADMDPSNPGFRWPISHDLARGAVEFIEKVGKAIFAVVKSDA